MTPGNSLSPTHLMTTHSYTPPRRTIQTRKSELIAASTYFETLFHSSFNESTSDTITLGGDVVSFQVLEMLVVFMESQALRPTEATVEQLFVAADYLQISSALRVLCDYLYADLAAKKLDDIRKGTVHMLLRLLDILSRFARASGYTYGTRTVTYINNHARPQAIKCTNEANLYLAYHFKTVMYDHGLLKLDIDSFEKVLRSDFLRLSEEEVVRIIKIWTNHAFDERRQHFGTLIKCVRFDETMKVDFIMEEVLDFVDCSAAKDYVISIFAKKLGYAKDICDIGPANPKVRVHRRWDAKDTPRTAAALHSQSSGSSSGVKEEPNVTL